MGENASAALVLGGLLLWCTGYAALLQRLHDRYVPDYVWLTVVLGNLWIIIAYAILNTLGFSGWAWLLAANAAGGTPVLLWQGWQAMDRRITRLKRANGRPAIAPGKKEEHGPPHEGRTQESRPHS